MKPATLVTAADFFALEAELFARIDALKEEAPLGPLLVVAPSNRMLWRIRRALLEGDRACLGLRLLNHRQLAAETVRAAGGEAPQAADPSLLAAALGRAIAGLPRPGPIARYARHYPGALASLAETFDHLREACVEATAARRVLKDDETVALYALYEKTLAVLEKRRNLTDAAGLARRAVEAAPGSPFLARAAALLHYGAYDLTQAQTDLLAEAAKRTPLHLLVPGFIEGPAGEYARRFLDSPLCRSAERRTARGAASWLAGRESALYDRDDAPSPAVPAGRGAPLVVTAVGARAELVFAARQALAFHRDGVPLSRIGIVARALDPYGPLIEGVFSLFGLPVSTSWSRPLASEAPVRAFLRLAEALAEGLPRTPLLEALAAGVRPAEEEPFPAPLLSRWERSARAARIVGGETDWTRRLPEWAAREEKEHRASFELVRDIRRLAKLAGSLAAEAARWGECRTWSDHASFLSGLADRWIPASGSEPETGALEALRARIAESGVLDDAAPGKGHPPVVPADAAALIARAVDAADAPVPSPDREGVAVLDVMQARGLVFDRMILLGLASDQWPRKPRPDPFLDDAARGALAGALDVRLPVEADAREEERLLLALTLSAARTPPILVVPRADDAGRARAPATLLREIARAVTGVPETERLLADAVPLPTDPARAARAEAERTGIATETEMILTAADAPDGALRAADAARAAGMDFPLFLRGLAHAEAVSRWEPGNLAYDGRVPSPPPPRSFTASRVEVLGECPLKHFFRHVLDLPDPGSDPDLLVPPDEVGSGTHDALARLYGRMAAEKAFPVTDLAEARRLAERFLPEAFAQTLEARLAGLAERLPLFWAAYRKRWIASLVSFVRWDLARLATTRAVPRFFEEKERSREAEIPTRAGTRKLPLKGRIDRIDEGPDGEITVFDYKTGRSIDGLVGLSDLLKGKDMQLPLYHFLARAVFPNRKVLPPWILGVGPAHTYEEGSETGSAACLEEIAEPDVQAALGDSLVALADLAAGGLFPMAPSRGCAWCPYEAACRRSHPPSARRVETAPEFASFRNLRARSATDPAGDGKGKGR